MRLSCVGSWVVASLMLVLLSESSFAGVIRHDQTDADYRALAAGYESVGMIRGSTGNSGYLGSGTLIADDWVLTAGHVVDIAQSLTFSIAGQQYEAADWIAHPLWDGNLGKGFDIALVRLDSAVGGIQPAERYRDGSEAGAIGTSVGFGRSGNGLTGTNTGAGTKRAGQNVVDGFDPRSGGRILMSDFDTPTSGSGALDLEYMIAPGDSGGGLFFDSPAGPLLAGVHSFGAAFDGTLNSDYGDLSGHTRVSAFNDWIDSILGLTDSPLSGYGDLAAGTEAMSQLNASGVTSVPEPAGLALAVLAGLGLIAVHGRRKS